MKPISVTIYKVKGCRGLTPPPKITGREKRMTGAQLIKWLKAQGAKPMDAETRRRLQASGNWGMPDE
jgi:hypothetical protein